MQGRCEGADRILVVDGDDSRRAALAAVLRLSGFETIEAQSGDEALLDAHAARPALVVLEVSLRDMSGYELCRRLRDAFGNGLAIMFVSALRTEPFDRVGGLLLGADDYVTEPFAVDELLARVRRLVDRSTANGAALGLTTREVEVLCLLADGANQTQIAATLVIAEKTVRTHIQRILVKLNVHSRAEAVARAHRSGIVPGMPVVRHRQ